jgi:FdhE protein
VTKDAWLASHPYLQKAADLHAMVDRAASVACATTSTTFSLDDYRDDLLRGVPLLHSSAIAIDWRPVESSIQALIDSLASSPLPGGLPEDIRCLSTELRDELDAPRRIVLWLLLQDDFESACPGLLRYLGWTAITWYLRPTMEAFDLWRDEDQWLRNYCPLCGSLPAMSQLIGFDQGRQRLLSCGCCGTRWRYRRSRCPFCENAEDDRLGVLTIEGESGLRIDYCKSCQAYLKTYAGTGNEAVMLADWTSIHLDVAACDRGLKRLGGSLYQLNPTSK